MAILIAKLNKGEIKWDDIDKELEIMRKLPSKQNTKNHTLQTTLNKVKKVEKILLTEKRKTSQ